MDVKTVPVASAREWRFHKAHAISAYQVVGRLYVGGAFVWMFALAFAAGAQGAIASVPRMHDVKWGPLTADLAVHAAGWLLGFVLPVVWLLLLLTPGAMTTWVAARLRLAAVRQSLAEEVNDGFADAESEPMAARRAIQVAALTVVTVGVFPAVGIGMGWSLLSTAPVVTAPIVAMALLTAMMIVGSWMVRDFVDVHLVAHAAATIVPRLRSARLRVARSPAECFVCVGVRRERPLIRRAFRAGAGWIGELIEKWAQRSIWVATLVAYRWLVLPGVVGATVIGAFKLSGADLAEVTVLGSMFVALLLMGTALWGGSNSIFDSMFNPDRINLRVTLGAFAAALAVMLNAQQARDLVTWMDAALQERFPDFDADMAMLCLLGLEACALYAVYAFAARRFGRTTRWAPREAVGGALLPLAGLAVSAVTGDWYMIALLTAVGAFVAYTKPFRERRSNRGDHASGG